MSIDVAGLKARTDIVAVIASYTPLKKMGAELCGPCPIHGGDGPNFYVNPRKGIWACFSHGCHECDEGNDVIGFIRRIEGKSFNEACEHLGAKDDWKPVARVVQKAPPLPDWVSKKPPPDAPKPDMHLRHLGDPSKVWPYRDSDGAPLGYVARYDAKDGKQIRCWTWGKHPRGHDCWANKHWSKPRPLYGLDKLASNPRTPVMIVEGEKAADAAQALLEDKYVVITWPGGSRAWHHASFAAIKGRTVLLWPDADQPGVECMQGLANHLADPRTLACNVAILDTTGMPDGFDAADWTGSLDELIAWAKPRKRIHQHIEDRKHGIEPPDVDYLPPDEPDEDEKPAAETPKRSNGATDDGVYYRQMSQVQSKAINWLWPGRIAKGKVSMIVGNPGLGKSQVCASISSVVSTGGMWPVDRVQCQLGSVVILSAEDDAEDTIRPRLEAAGADLERIYILDAIRVDRDDGEGKRGFDLQQDVARLGAMLHEIGDVALVIIDPITAYLGDADSHKNAEVRALLAPLSEMAAAQGAAIIAVSHLTKSSGMEALLRVQGSIGFAAAARAVWGVAKDKDNPSRRMFMPLKNNIGTDVSGFAYTVEGCQLIDSDIQTSCIMWENQLVTMTADEVFGASELAHGEQSALLDAKLFLRDLLREGPLDSKQIEADARGAGHSMSTLRRAAKELNLKIAKDGFGRGSPWKWWPPDAVPQ